MTQIRFTIRVEEEYYNRLDSEAKKLNLKLNTKNEFINFLIEKYFTGGSTNPELTVKQQTEKVKLEILEIKKPHEKLKKLSNTLKLWNELKYEGYTLEQYQKMLQDGEIQKPLSNFIPRTEPEKQFKSYGTTIIHSKPQDADKVRCPDCNWCLDYKPKDITTEVNHMIDHLKSIHHRTPTEEEQKILMELIKE